MLSEILIGADDPDAVLRTVYLTPSSYGIGQLDALAQFCDEIPTPPSQYGYQGVSSVRGRPWFDISFGHGQYNHSLGPNRPSCMNRNHLPTGVHTAASGHPGGVNVAFADGHVEFIANGIDLAVWRSMGSRVDKSVAY